VLLLDCGAGRNGSANVVALDPFYSVASKLQAKLLEAQERRWWRTNGYGLVPLVWAEARRVNRELVEGDEEKGKNAAWLERPIHNFFTLPLIDLNGRRSLSEGATMPLLHIAFQEGFMDDIVVVRVNDKEVYRKPNVRTELQIGFADSCEVDVRENMVKVEVVLPLRSLTKSIPVVFDSSAPVYLGLSITPEASISERVSREPFGYL
jgi:hypothetical protein